MIDYYLTRPLRKSKKIENYSYQHIILDEISRFKRVDLYYQKINENLGNFEIIRKMVEIEKNRILMP